MLTKTEIANQALAILSAGTITNFDDDDDEKSRVISGVFDQVAKQVIRSHRWSCCIRRATLARLAESPTKTATFGYKYKYQLPADNLRFLDLNGEPWKDKTRGLDINGLELHTNETAANIRYVAWVSNVAEWDVLLGEAVAVKLAMRIARRITSDGISSEELYKLYRHTVAHAQHVDAMEVGSGENSPLERILESSPTVENGRGYGGIFRPVNRVGLDVDYSTPR